MVNQCWRERPFSPFSHQFLIPQHLPLLFTVTSDSPSAVRYKDTVPESRIPGARRDWVCLQKILQVDVLKD